MIIFKPDKEKKLSFTVTVEGIDPKLLEYTLRLSDSKIDYGFKGTNENGSIVFTIPPLNTIVNRERLDEIQKIKLEVNDANNKYYLKPFMDDVKIKTEPKLAVEMTVLEDEKDNFGVHVNEVVENDDSIKTKSMKRNIVKKSKFSKLLEDK